MKKYSKRTFEVITLEQILSESIAYGDCLISPRSKRNGYPFIIRTKPEKSKYFLHRLVCEYTYGLPKPNEMALHSCDNPSCINPKHLRWGTAADNAKDREIRNRGTSLPKEQNPAAKLSAEQVNQIRHLLTTGMTQTEIGNLFGVSHAMVSNIKLNKNWIV